MNMSPVIAHLTSAHPRGDTRIFLKECQSLAMAGYTVYLIVGDGQGDEFRNGVSILDVGISKSRIDRMLNITRKIFDRAKSVNADIYHLHDPELIPTGLKLKKIRKKVIFDAHEDVPKQLLGKPYLSRYVKYPLALIFKEYEKRCCPKFDAIVAATPYIREKFLTINEKTVDINNFPILGELCCQQDAWETKQNQICYIGGISRIRGIQEIVDAMQFTCPGVRLQLGGVFNESDIANQVRASPGWSQVDELGFLDRHEVKNVLTRCRAGLVILHPLSNYLDSLPVKMFEYMSAGIPVISSNFPLWKKIIEKHNCGFCVDPFSPREIAKAIDSLINNPEQAKELGENGRQAVLNAYNWGKEELKLNRLYSNILHGTL